MQNNSSKYILIIWDSMTGGSHAMAQAAAVGAGCEDNINVKVLHAHDVSIDDMLSASAYIFAFPENLAAISGVMKSFFDRTYYHCIEQIEGRSYALMICAGSDGENAMNQANRICKGWRLKLINNPIIIKTHAQSKEEILAQKTIASDDLQKCHDIGTAMATGLAIGLY